MEGNKPIKLNYTYTDLESGEIYTFTKEVYLNMKCRFINLTDINSGKIIYTGTGGNIENDSFKELFIKDYDNRNRSI